MQKIVMIHNSLRETAKLVAISAFSVAAFGCSLCSHKDSTVVVNATHSNVHGTIVENIPFGKSDAGVRGSKVKVMPLRSDFRKHRLLVRVTELPNGDRKEAWVKEGEWLIGFPGIGPLGAKLLKVKHSSAVFEFGFAE